MLEKSKLSSAPSSERSSASFSRASRWVRSRSTSTRSSQSTAFGPYVRIPMTPPPYPLAVRLGSTPSRARRQVLLNGVAADDAPDGHRRLAAGVAEPVRGGRREADRVPRPQLVGVEADVDGEAAGQHVAELLAGVPHEGAVAGGAAAGLVLDLEELDPRVGPGREPPPVDARFQLQGLVLAGPL